MKKFTDNIEDQVTKAAQAYYDQGLETFFLPKAGDKTLDELIQRRTGLEVTRTNSYGYGSMIEFRAIQYRGRTKDITAKFCVSVNYDITDGVLNNINVGFGL